MEIFLISPQVEQLKRTHKRGERRFADRLKAILLINSGYAFGKVAEIPLMDNNTVRRYLEFSTLKEPGV